MKKLLTTTLAIAMCLALFAGCSSQAPVTPAASAPSEQPEQSAPIPTADKTPVTLTFWCHSNEAFVKANDVAIKAFTDANPNYTIKTEQFPASDFMKKLQASFAAKQTADFIQVFGSEVVPYVKGQLLAPVSDAMQAEIEANFLPAGIGAFRGQDGKIYGIPREVNLESGGVLYYPQDLKAVGYDEFPKTYEELIDAAQKLVKYDADGKIVKSGFDMYTTWSNLFYFYALILQQNGAYLAQDGVHVEYTTPEAEKAMQAIADLFLKYKVTSFEHIAADGSSDTFFKKNSSMCFIGPWTIPLGKMNFDNDDFLYGKMPSFTGTSNAFVTETGWGLVVAGNSKNVEAAWRVVEHLTNAENAMAFNVATGTIPARKSVVESQEFRKSSDHRLATSLDVLPEGRYIGPFPSVWSAMEILEKHTKSIIEQGVAIPAALAAAEEETNKLIDELNAQ